MASLTEPPAELMKTGSRRPLSLATTRSSASAVPVTILPSAEIHSGQSDLHPGALLATRMNRIGASDVGEACGVGAAAAAPATTAASAAKRAVRRSVWRAGAL